MTTAETMHPPLSRMLRALRVAYVDCPLVGANEAAAVERLRLGLLELHASDRPCAACKCELEDIAALLARVVERARLEVS